MKASIIFSTILFVMALSLDANAMHKQKNPKYVTCQTDQVDQNSQACQTDQTSQACQTDPNCESSKPGNNTQSDCGHSDANISTNYHSDDSDDSSCSESGGDEDNQNTSICNGKSIVHLRAVGGISGYYHDQLLRTKHFHARKVTGINIWSPKSKTYKTVSRDQAKAMSKIVKNNQDSCCIIEHGKERYIDINQWADQL